jgi:rhodanese-related sulfurtransferase
MVGNLSTHGIALAGACLGEMMKKFILIIIITLLPVICSAAVQQISPKRVYDLIREGSGLWMIDVRSSQLFNLSHIEGAISIPLVDLPSKRLPENKILVLVDNSLGQSQARQAAELLSTGRSKVFVLSGGIRGWQREGLPVVGVGNFYELARVLPNELERARQSGVPLKIVDLRTESERKQAPVSGSVTVEGSDFDKQLNTVLAEVKRPTEKSIAALKAPIPSVLVLPTEMSAAELYQERLWNLPGDVRILEGAYLSGAEQETKTVKAGGCMTCPAK